MPPFHTKSKSFKGLKQGHPRVLLASSSSSSYYFPSDLSFFSDLDRKGLLLPQGLCICHSLCLNTLAQMSTGFTSLTSFRYLLSVTISVRPSLVILPKTGTLPSLCPCQSRQLVINKREGSKLSLINLGNSSLTVTPASLCTTPCFTFTLGGRDWCGSAGLPGEG